MVRSRAEDDGDVDRGRADCPDCGDGGFVTSRTNGMGEAECLTKDCSVVIFEVDDAE